MHKLIQKYVRAIHALGALSADDEAEGQARVVALGLALKAHGLTDRMLLLCERHPRWVIRRVLNHEKLLWVRTAPVHTLLDGFDARVRS